MLFYGFGIKDELNIGFDCFFFCLKYIVKYILSFLGGKECFCIVFLKLKLLYIVKIFVGFLFLFWIQLRDKMLISISKIIENMQRYLNDRGNKDRVRDKKVFL